jgi:hypothetical protein
MAMLPEYMQVEEKIFYIYIRFMRENMPGFYSQSAMIANRINYFDGDDNMHAYQVSDYGHFFYIKRDAMKDFLKEDT